MVKIENKIHDHEHTAMYSSDDNDAKYSRGGEFLENMMSDNILEFSRRWMSLGDIYDVIGDINEFYSFNDYTGKGLNTTIYDAIYPVSKDAMIPAIENINYNSNMSNAITFINTLDEDTKTKLQEEIRKDALL